MPGLASIANVDAEARPVAPRPEKPARAARTISTPIFSRRMRREPKWWAMHTPAR